MSSLMTGMIWKAKGLQGVERLILLAVADEANSMGECYLELQMLARKVDMELEAFMVQLTRLSSKNYITVTTAANGDYIGLWRNTLTEMGKVGQAATPPPLETPKSTAPVVKHHLRSRVSKTVEEREKKTTAKVAKVRERNLTWDALLLALGMEDKKLTGSETSDFAKTVKELKQVEATPEQIAGFPSWWSRQFKDCVCTHRCFRLHWAGYMADMEKRVSKSNELDL